MEEERTMENGPSQAPGYPEALHYRFIPPSLEGLEFVPNFGDIVFRVKGQFLAWGGTAVLERLPSGNVVKTPLPNPYFQREHERHRKSMCIEAIIYEILKDHPRVPKYLDWDPTTCCLTMEYVENGSLADFLERNHQSIADSMRRKWARQAAEGVQLLHHHNIIHSDLSPHNFLVDSNLDLKVSDFAGASVFGAPGSALPGTRYRDPHVEGYVLRSSDDIFSLGSVIYFIMTGKHPYQDLPSDNVKYLFQCSQFPEVGHLSCGSIIRRCWLLEVDATEVYEYFSRHG
ncbi:kinase-like protein [Aspergillus piperis CBS 112811]|uniref:EKC/KEOPS complex subunit BUD32 n=1 Tax=Aspergillus piperis CBS 112811 TaxID=1448313 RepID=A0A8G1QTV9_9EURO|nr:kinase-like protein [Aspergillus piperis CBS 112811]RAH53574.1 kinase-like protein [Aspergillus piperis CBS 112811]